jgi:ankyrin repeat protein
MDFTDLQGFNKGKEMKKVAFTVFLILLSCQLALFSADIFTVAGSGTVAQVLQAIKAGVDVNLRDGEGSTPLMFAGFNTNPDVISVLIKAGADVNARNVDGLTPLMFAAEHNTNPEVLSVLIKAGADVNARNERGSTALKFAKDNPAIKGTKVYWELNDAQYK